MAQKLVIAGAGGFGTEGIWIAEAMNQARPDNPPWEILGYVDDNPEKTGQQFYGYPVLGTPEKTATMYRDPIAFIPQIGKNRIRKKVAERLMELDWKPATLIHPNVVIAREVTIGMGVYIGPGTVLAPASMIGDFVIINTHAGIGHHSVLGDFCQICPGARITGACKVGAFAFIGSNTVLQPGISIGEGATAGSGSQVIRSVQPQTTVLGVPARIVSRPSTKESPAHP